jgi:predicted HAD superfamily hydrolase
MMFDRNQPWITLPSFILILCFLCSGVVDAENPGAKKTVHSFDVFDTLVGRVHKDPTSVFYLVESRYPFPGFSSKRIQAEYNSNGTLNDIYRSFVSLTGISEIEAQKLREFEIETELSNVFPIMCNISRVQDGDILVSDTYYDDKEILRIVRHAGLKKNVEIFATVDGKCSSWIWPYIQRRYNILEHEGDNQYSDVSSPRRYGIQAKWFELSEYSPLEQQIFNTSQKELANLMRVLRLSNPHQQGSIAYSAWNEQAQINIPLLIVTSFLIDDFCKKNVKQKVLFLSPGTGHLIKIFGKLFPQYSSETLLISRDLYMHPTQDYMRYMRSVYIPTSS